MGDLRKSHDLIKFPHIFFIRTMILQDIPTNRVEDHFSSQSMTGVPFYAKYNALSSFPETGRQRERIPFIMVSLYG